MTLRERFAEWRKAASTQRAVLLWRKRLWGVVVLYGLIDYVGWLDLPGMIADSVPVLFFLSGFALYTGDQSTAQGYRVEEKQEEAEAQAHGV